MNLFVFDMATAANWALPKNLSSIYDGTFLENSHRFDGF